MPFCAETANLPPELMMLTYPIISSLNILLINELIYVALAVYCRLLKSN